MTERELRETLQTVPVEDARARALDVVRAAYRDREPLPRRRRWAPSLAVAACLVVAVVMAGTAGAPGDAVARWVRQVLGTGAPHARPALVHVPGGGRLLVNTADGPWVVAADGSRRRLGDYAGASWSPQGLFVVAWRGRELYALEPDGTVRWSLARSHRIVAARWAPGDGYRVAYLSGGLRVVNGDGTGDRAFAPARAVAPAWRPHAHHVLAYVDRQGRVRVVAVDSGRQLWRSSRLAGVRQLAWSADGRRLAIATARAQGARTVAAEHVAWSPGGRLTVVRHGEVRVGGRVVFRGPGRLGPVAWSPRGQRLLVPWAAADQWLFVAKGRTVAIGNIARQFGAFPAQVEWCCQ